MTFVVLYGGIALFASILVLMDFFGRRQQWRTRKTVASASPSSHADDFWP